MKKVIIVLVSMFFIVSVSYLFAQERVYITDLPESTSMTNDDILIVVDDPSGSPVTKKITYDSFNTSLASTIYDPNFFYVDNTNETIGLFQPSPISSAYLQLADDFIICKTKSP